MPLQLFCNNWSIDVPSDVIHLSELLENMDMMDFASCEVSVECSKETLLDAFNILRRMRDLYDKIYDIDVLLSEESPDKNEMVLLEQLEELYNDWKLMTPLLQFLEPTHMYMNMLRTYVFFRERA